MPASFGDLCNIVRSGGLMQITGYDLPFQYLPGASQRENSGLSDFLEFLITVSLAIGECRHMPQNSLLECTEDFVKSSQKQHILLGLLSLIKLKSIVRY